MLNDISNLKEYINNQKAINDTRAPILVVTGEEKVELLNGCFQVKQFPAYAIAYGDTNRYLNKDGKPLILEDDINE